MVAPKGNQFWKLRSKHGRDKLFSSPDLLWEAAVEYFEWCDKHPLKETKAFHAQGLITTTELPLLRAYTMAGLQLYMGCNDHYFSQFKKALPEDEQDFSSIITRIEKTIYVQKFTGAAAELLNPNIIARDLGLTDKQDHTTKGDKMSPITITVDSSETAETLKKLRDGAKTD